MRTKLLLIGLLFAIYPISQSWAKEPENIGTLRHQVKNYYHSGKYMTDAKKVIHRAHDYIALQAKRFQNKRKKLAIVLDIDETSLSNYAKLEAREFIGDRQTIHHEIMAGGSPALSPMLKLYQDSIKQGIAVFFVTGRTESEKWATIKNLKEAGYHKWTGLYLRPDKYSLHSIVPFKSNSRREITKMGYTIIASIGDQESDYKGGYTMKGFKMPNPYYYVP